MQTRDHKCLPLNCASASLRMLIPYLHITGASFLKCSSCRQGWTSSILLVPAGRAWITFTLLPTLYPIRMEAGSGQVSCLDDMTLILWVFIRSIHICNLWIQAWLKHLLCIIWHQFVWCGHHSTWLGLQTKGNMRHTQVQSSSAFLKHYSLILNSGKGNKQKEQKGLCQPKCLRGSPIQGCGRLSQPDQGHSA